MLWRLGSGRNFGPLTNVSNKQRQSWLYIDWPALELLAKNPAFHLVKCIEKECCNGFDGFVENAKERIHLETLLDGERGAGYEYSTRLSLYHSFDPTK